MEHTTTIGWVVEWQDGDGKWHETGGRTSISAAVCAERYAQGFTTFTDPWRVVEVIEVRKVVSSKPASAPKKPKKK